MDKKLSKKSKRKKRVDRTVETMPVPTKKIFKPFCNAQNVTVTFDDIAGCDSVLLV